MTRTLIAPRTYTDATGRFWARYPVNRRYTWRLLRDDRNQPLTSKRTAIATAQALASGRAVNDFEALARLYLAAGCPDKRHGRRAPAFIAAETARTHTLIKFFARYNCTAIRLKLLPQYAVWRQRRVRHGTGERTVEKDLCTLSNILNYGVIIEQVEFNWISRNRPPQRRAEDIRHSRALMPKSADVIHQLGAEHLNTVRSEVFAWMTWFAMFTGCRTSELLRLRVDAADENAAGYYHGQRLYLGRRSKNGLNPWTAVGPEFASMIACFELWHRKRHPKSPWYFPSPQVHGSPVGPGAHGHAITRACKDLGLPHTIPHALRAYYVTKRRRDGAQDSHIAAEIGDRTVSLISTVYGENLVDDKLSWLPAPPSLPAWLRWQPVENKLARAIGKT